jgi:hypothetical protein
MRYDRRGREKMREEDRKRLRKWEAHLTENLCYEAQNYFITD